MKLEHISKNEVSSIGLMACLMEAPIVMSRDILLLEGSVHPLRLPISVLRYLPSPFFVVYPIMSVLHAL